MNSPFSCCHTDVSVSAMSALTDCRVLYRPCGHGQWTVVRLATANDGSQAHSLPGLPSRLESKQPIVALATAAVHCNECAAPQSLAENVSRQGERNRTSRTRDTSVNASTRARHVDSKETVLAGRHSMVRYAQAENTCGSVSMPKKRLALLRFVPLHSIDLFATCRNFRGRPGA